MHLLREQLRRLNPELHQQAEICHRISLEQAVVADAATLARAEQNAIEFGERYPTYWDRYAELRSQYGLPPAPRPSV